MENLNKILFYDTEFVGIKRHFKDLEKPQQNAVLFQWRKDKEFVELEKNCVKRKTKTSKSKTCKEFYEEWWSEKAGLTDFTKIVCFSFGWINDGKLKTSSYTIDMFDSEEKFLEKIITAMSQTDLFNSLCAHSLDADLRSITRDCIRLGYSLPPLVVKCIKATPWQYNSSNGSAFCTNKLSLRLYGKFIRLVDLCTILQVQSPKDRMDGSMVHKAFYDGKINEIAEYCEKDVNSLFYCFSKLYTYI